MYLWPFYIGLPGAMNDLNVMAFSLLFQSMLAGSFPPPISFPVNCVEHTLPYCLSDGIYTEHPVLINTSKRRSEKDRYFAGHQEGRRQDAERVFGVLNQKWQVLDRPVRLHSVQTLVMGGACCATLQSMIVTHRRKEAQAPEPGTHHLIFAAFYSFLSV